MIIQRYASVSSLPIFKIVIGYKMRNSPASIRRASFMKPCLHGVLPISRYGFD